jgi:hypothetical protein
MRDHYEQVERQTGKRPPELIGPEFPRRMSHIWSAFLDLSTTRPQGFNGPLPIPYTEIKAYEDFYGLELTPLDIDTIKRLDNAFLRTANNG